MISNEFTAVAVTAIYGILLASRQGMDVVGMFTIACVVAFGGSTLRDLFLDRQLLSWIGKSAGRKTSRPHNLQTKTVREVWGDRPWLSL